MIHTGMEHILHEMTQPYLSESCVICLNPIEPGEMCSMQACGHCIHPDCDVVSQMPKKCYTCRQWSVAVVQTFRPDYADVIFDDHDGSSSGGFTASVDDEKELEEQVALVLQQQQQDDMVAIDGIDDEDEPDEFPGEIGRWDVYNRELLRIDNDLGMFMETFGGGAPDGAAYGGIWVSPDESMPMYFIRIFIYGIKLFPFEYGANQAALMVGHSGELCFMTVENAETVLMAEETPGLHWDTIIGASRAAGIFLDICDRYRLGSAIDIYVTGRLDDNSLEAETVQPLPDEEKSEEDDVVTLGSAGSSNDQPLPDEEESEEDDVVTLGAAGSSNDHEKLGTQGNWWLWWRVGLVKDVFLWGLNSGPETLLKCV
jgi:hypothetical protein